MALNPRFIVMLLALFGLLGLGALPASAVYEKQDGFPWNLTLHGIHDKPIVDKLGGGFFMNVGPTGIRAQITHQHPAFFTVKFVFKDSPAAGKIKAGDIIVGANGKVMDVPHQFGRRTVTGWRGPMQEMAKHIEDSQGKDGKLELMVWPGGNKSDAKKVEIQIDAVGRFSKTFPFNCERSDKLMIGLCDFLVDEYERDGKFGRPHAHGAAILALMASGENKYSKVIRQVMSRYPNKRYDPDNGGGFPTWGWGYDGIVMGEYYLLTKDKSLLPAMESLAVAYRDGQDWRTGGYMHKPFPFITKRIAGGGPKGYGSMSQPGGLAMIAQSIFAVADISYDEATLQRTHQAFLYSVGANGEIGYGFKAWEHAIIRPTGDSVANAKNKRGIGYVLQNGMEGLENFDVVWPTKADPRYKPLDWIKTEAKRVRVYVNSDDTLMLVRDQTQPEPKGPFRHNGGRAGHYGRSGQGAIAHAIGAAKYPTWKLLADHMGQSCANSADSIFDGHASTLMHTHWGSLGAYFGGEKAFRHYMDNIKWWFIMGQTHDGSYVPMPGRDYASTDHVYATRIMPSAIAALILSTKEAKLQITGAGAPMVPPTGTPEDGRNASGPQRTTPEEPAALTTMLGEGFKVEHNLEAAEALNEGAPYARVLRVLDLAMAEGDAKGKEAIRFALKLREWIGSENARLTKLAEERPAHALIAARDHAQRLVGYEMPDAQALRDLVKQLNADRDVRTLARYYELLDRINTLEAKRGSSSTTARDRDRIKTTVDKFLEKPGLSDAVINDAKQLLAELAKSPTASSE